MLHSGNMSYSCILRGLITLRILDRYAQAGHLHHRNLSFLFGNRRNSCARQRSGWSRIRSRRRYRPCRRSHLRLPVGSDISSNRSRWRMNRSLLYRWSGSYLRRLSGGRLWEHGFYSLFRATPTTHIIPLGGKLRNLYQGQFYQQTLVLADAVIQITFVTELHRLIQERQRAFLRLFLITLADTRSHLKQRKCYRIFAYQQIAKVRRQSGYKVTSVESLIQHIIEKQQRITHFIGKKAIRQTEIIFVIKYIQVVNHAFIRDISSGKTHHLVEDRQCVAHTSICFHGNHVQCFRLCWDSFFRSNIRKMIHRIFHTDTIEIINLTTGKNGRKNFMLLRRGQDENSMTGRFFQRFQKRIECRSRKHVYLVDDINLILANLWRDTHLLHQLTNIVHRVVGGCIKLMDIIRPLKATQDSHWLQASPSAVGVMQLIVLAKIRAQVVFPTPRGPQNKYAWASFWVAIAFFSVVVSARCPTTDSNVEGRYLRADTI